jgi:hypothetical protein
MTGPSEPSATPGPPAAPDDPDPQSGPRRLDRAPGERLAAAPVASTADAMTAGSLARAVGMGAIGGGIGIVVYLILAIGFTFTAGLLVVAIFTGRFVGLFVRAGAGRSLSSPARAVVAVVVFLAALSVTIAATWLWSRVEGGDLALADYLDQAYGTPLISLEFMVGTLTAWWSAR